MSINENSDSIVSRVAQRAVALPSQAFFHHFASPLRWMEKWPLLNRLQVDLQSELAEDAIAATLIDEL